MQNIQPIEKQVLSSGPLSVHSIFETIQGEGPFCGTPCVFIRLAGCNLQCPACDTDYTSGRSAMTIDAILAVTTSKRDRGLIVITGGEPFRQPIRELCWRLYDEGFYIQIESNGTLAPPPGLPYNTHPEQKRGVYIVCSPKTGKINPNIYYNACALKYVVEAGDINPEDGLPLSALRHTSSPHPARPPFGWDRPVYIQPMDAHDGESNMLNHAAAVEACLRFGHILQIQIHKVIGVE